MVVLKGLPAELELTLVCAAWLQSEVRLTERIEGAGLGGPVVAGRRHGLAVQAAVGAGGRPLGGKDPWARRWAGSGRSETRAFGPTPAAGAPARSARHCRRPSRHYLGLDAATLRPSGHTRLEAGGDGRQLAVERDLELAVPVGRRGPVADAQHQVVGRGWSSG